MLLLKEFDVTTKALRILAALLCKFIYSLIASIFELFINISKVEILSSDNIKPIYQRVTLILAIIMVFYVTFEFVKYVIEPDSMTDKEKGADKIVTKMILVVLLIAFVPTIFNYAYKFQNAIINRQVIPKIILGSSDTNGNFGKEFAASTFGLFYHYNENIENGDDKGCDGASCKIVAENNLQGLRENGTLENITFGINEVKENYKDGHKQTIPYITFDGLFAVLTGGFILYILILYCIDIGTRLFQLAFLQIIAPIPIIGYLSPKKDNIFTKWAKQCILVYLDLFIRLAIIYFVLFICQILSEAWLNGTLVNNLGTSSSKLLLYVALILGLLMFAQRMPKLLQEIFPKLSSATGSFGLKAGERVAPLAARALGAGTALGRVATTGLVRRAAWAHARNKANKVDTKEGRERHKKQYEKHKKDYNDAKTRAGNYKTDEKAMNEYRKAKNEWDKKSGSARDNLMKAGEAIKKARAEGRTVTNEELKKFEEAKAEYGKLRNSQEYKNLQKAQEKIRNSATMGEYMKQGGEFSRLKAEVQNANNLYKNAQKVTAEARKKGDVNEIKAAEEAEKEAKSNLTRAQSNLFNQSSETVGSLMKKEQEDQEQIQAQYEQQAEKAHEDMLLDKNTAYQGAFGVLGGTAVGAIKAAGTGLKTTKLGDVVKNSRQAAQNDIKDVKAVEKYYDEGGTGWIDRTIQQVEKSIGTPTAYERTVLENRALEPEIKTLEAQTALTKDVKATADSAEDRLKEKIGDLKLEARSNTIKTGLKNAAGEDIYAEVASNETLADVYRKYEGRATKAQAEADAAAKRLDENSAIISQNRDALNDEQKVEYDKAVAERANLERVADEKATEAARAKYAVSQVQKNAARYEYSQILNDFANGETFDNIRKKKYDGPAIEKVYDALRSLAVARSNPTIVDDMRKNLEPAIFEQFMSGRIRDFDTLDAIKVAAINAGNVYERDAKAKKEQKRSSETSNRTSAQKAANDYNPTGGNN